MLDPLAMREDAAFPAAVFRWIEATPPPQPHPLSKLFREALTTALDLARPFSGELYRFCSRRYANLNDAISGFGSQLRGGRFNPPRSFRIVYLSIDRATAEAEILKRPKNPKAKPLADFPLLPPKNDLLTVRAVLHTVLDLTDTTVLARLSTVGVDLEFLTHEEWWVANERGAEAATQAIGRVAFELGLHGLITYSAAEGGNKNLDVFTPNLPIGCGLEVVDPPDIATHWGGSPRLR
jgi:RES domain-containing protein